MLTYGCTWWSRLVHYLHMFKQPWKHICNFCFLILYLFNHHRWDEENEVCIQRKIVRLWWYILCTDDLWWLIKYFLRGLFHFHDLHDFIWLGLLYFSHWIAWVRRSSTWSLWSERGAQCRRCCRQALINFIGAM